MILQSVYKKKMELVSCLTLWDVIKYSKSNRYLRRHFRQKLPVGYLPSGRNQSPKSISRFYFHYYIPESQILNFDGMQYTSVCNPPMMPHYLGLNLCYSRKPLMMDQLLLLLMWPQKMLFDLRVLQ